MTRLLSRLVGTLKRLWRRWTAIDIPWPDVPKHQRLQADMRRATFQVRKTRLELKRTPALSDELARWRADRIFGLEKGEPPCDDA